MSLFPLLTTDRSPGFDGNRGASLRPPAVAAATWFAFLIAVCVKTVLSPTQHTTYPCFEAGARGWWADLDLYNFEVLKFEFRYTPTFAVLFSLFAIFPTVIGGVLWNVVNVAATFASLGLFIHKLAPVRLSPNRVTAFYVLSLVASARGLWAAQSNMLIFAAAVAGLAALLDRRLWLASTWLAAPIFIKLWPAALALLAITSRPRALFTRMSVAVAVFALVPTLTRPWDAVVSQHASLIHGLTTSMQERHIYRDAWTIFEALQIPVDPAAYKMLQLFGAGLVLLATLVVQIRGDERRSLFVMFASWIAWQLLLGPGSERNTYCLVGPVVAYAVLMPQTSRISSICSRGAAVLIITFSFGIAERKLATFAPAIETALPIGVLFLSGWIATLVATRPVPITTDVANPEPVVLPASSPMTPRQPNRSDSPSRSKAA